MEALGEDWTEADVEAAIARDDPAELLYVPIAVSLAPPGRVWAEQVCLRLARHHNATVRGNAILGLGHLARTFRFLNRSAVQPIIEGGLKDADAYVRGQTEAAADDIEWFLGWILAGREDNLGRPVCRR